MKERMNGDIPDSRTPALSHPLPYRAKKGGSITVSCQWIPAFFSAESVNHCAAGSLVDNCIDEQMSEMSRPVY
jgi:hypothetical protein